MSKIHKYRFLILRRVVQLLLLFLFAGSNIFGWHILRGNYSSGVFFDKIHLADPYATLQILATGFVAGADVLWGATIVLILYGLIFGRMFCSWVCPMNIIADTAIYGNKKMQLKNTINISRKTRYGILLLGLLLSFILATPAFEIISPVAMLHRAIIFGVGGAWAIIFAIFLFDLAIVRYGWCGHLCPVGAFYAMVGKFALIKVKHNAQNCTNCGKCFDVCHEKQVLSIINVKSGFVKSAECTNCLRCIEACNDNALKLSIINPITINKAD